MDMVDAQLIKKRDMLREKKTERCCHQSMGLKMSREYDVGRTVNKDDGAGFVILLVQILEYIYILYLPIKFQ